MRYFVILTLLFTSLVVSQESNSINQTLEKQWVNSALESIQLRGQLRGVDIKKLLNDSGLDTIVFKDQTEMPQPTNEKIRQVNAYAQGKKYNKNRVKWEEIRLSRVLLNYEFRIFERILAHEIGHVLGLHHCCEEENSGCINKFICMEVMSIGHILDGDLHKGLYPNQFKKFYWDNFFTLIKKKNSSS